MHSLSPVPPAVSGDVFPTGASDARIVRVRDRTVGLAVADGTGVRFYASCQDVQALDGRLFPSLTETEVTLRRSAGPQPTRSFRQLRRRG